MKRPPCFSKVWARQTSESVLPSDVPQLKSYSKFFVGVGVLSQVHICVRKCACVCARERAWVRMRMHS